MKMIPSFSRSGEESLEMKGQYMDQIPHDDIHFVDVNLKSNVNNNRKRAVRYLYFDFH